MQYAMNVNTVTLSLGRVYYQFYRVEVVIVVCRYV